MTVEKNLSEISAHQLRLDNIGFLEQKSYLQSAEWREANQTRLLPRVSAGGFAASIKKKSDDKHT